MRNKDIYLLHKNMLPIHLVVPPLGGRGEKWVYACGDVAHYRYNLTLAEVTKMFESALVDGYYQVPRKTFRERLKL